MNQLAKSKKGKIIYSFLMLRPFISRVDPKDRLGVNPVKKIDGITTKKPRT
jgi:hypothetical protein